MLARLARLSYSVAMKKENDDVSDAFDEVWRSMGITRRGEEMERQDGRLVVPLTLRNRFRLICVALGRRRRVRF